MLGHVHVIFLLLFHYISSIDVGVPTPYKKLTIQFEKFTDGNQFIRNIINGSSRIHRLKQGDGLDELVALRDRVGNEKNIEISDFQKDQKVKFCCRQPIMMPTFITGHAFDEITKRLQEIHQ